MKLLPAEADASEQTDHGTLIPFRPNRSTVEARYVRSPESQIGQTLRRKVNVRIPKIYNREKISGHKARDIAHPVGE